MATAAPVASAAHAGYDPGAVTRAVAGSTAGATSAASASLAGYATGTPAKTAASAGRATSSVVAAERLARRPLIWSFQGTSAKPPAAQQKFGEFGEADFLAGKKYLLRGTGLKGAQELADRGGQHVAVVCTLRDAQTLLMDWLEWYRLAGFSHAFLYFDDPEHDQGIIQEACAAYSADFLSIVCNGPELQAEWPLLQSWQDFQAFTNDRMCRQLLNLAHCVRRCCHAKAGSAESANWLLHLDLDELFLPPPDGLQAHFRHLAASGCRLCLYENFEAVPEDHTLNPFRDVVNFKVPFRRVPKTPAGARGLQFWKSRTKAGNYFLYYDNGKSAVRIRRGAAAEFAPRSVHVLVGSGAHEAELAERRQGWTTYPEVELEELGLGWLVSKSEEIVAAAKVLHYPATHGDQLFRKYNHLKNFPAVRFGGDLIVPPSFHLEARDCYVEHMDEGPEVQKQCLRELLERVGMIRDAREAEEQFRCGTIVCIDEVGKSLRLGELVPSRCQGRGEPLLLNIETLNDAPSIDAEVLFQEAGSGLVQQFEAGLDLLAKRLETVGWVACKLGANPAALRKALSEAQLVEGDMMPGRTVIENRDAPDPSIDPRARRGDKILWMEEQGLSMRCGGKSRTPALALMESALVDIGMQLDARLQQSSLRLRITESLDAMLACYDVGSDGYNPHIDNADGDGRADGRVLTAMLYLNQDWDRSHGGELAIFQPDPASGVQGTNPEEESSEPLAVGEADTCIRATDQGRWHIVRPEADTLVLFRADRTLHEVRRSLAKRFALSVWFCGRPADVV